MAGTRNGHEPTEMDSSGGGPDAVVADVCWGQKGLTFPSSLPGECSCHEGYAPDPVHRHLCVRSDWGHSEG